MKYLLILSLLLFGCAEEPYHTDTTVTHIAPDNTKNNSRMAKIATLMQTLEAIKYINGHLHGVEDKDVEKFLEALKKEYQDDAAKLAKELID